MNEDYETGFDKAWAEQQKEIDAVRRLLFDVLTVRPVEMDAGPVNEAFERAFVYMRNAWPGWTDAFSQAQKPVCHCFNETSRRLCSMRGMCMQIVAASDGPNGEVSGA